MIYPTLTYEWPFMHESYWNLGYFKLIPILRKIDTKIYSPIILHDIQISFMGAHNIDLNKLSNKHECSMVVLFVKTSQYIDIEWNSHFRILFENIGRLKICLDMEN